MCGAPYRTEHVIFGEQTRMVSSSVQIPWVHASDGQIRKHVYSGLLNISLKVLGKRHAETSDLDRL